MSRVLVVALNLSLDKTLLVDEALLGEETRVKAVRWYSGGKAVNVTRTLRALDVKTMLIGVLAGTTGKLIEENLSSSGFLQEWVYGKGETRTNITLQIQKSKKNVRLLEPGEPLTGAVQNCFKKIFLKNLIETNVAVFSGSLPPATDTGLYARLIHIAQSKHVMTVLDTSGEALREGLKASPFIIKPNRQEAEDVLGYGLSSVKAWKRSLKDLAGYGPRIVLVSLGDEGLIGFDGSRMFMAQGPKCKGLTVGCGDAALAGFLSAFLKGEAFDHCVRFATACGAANVDVGIPGMLNKKKIKSVFLRTRVKQLV